MQKGKFLWNQIKKDKWISISRTNLRNISSDPCESNPCNGTNSHCVKESAFEYECKCDTNYVPKSENAKKYGCEEKGNYY